jgi:hypothetical protein
MARPNSRATPASPDPDVTAADFTPAEAAAWAVAEERRLAITRADLRALLNAAKEQIWWARPEPQEIDELVRGYTEERLRENYAHAAIHPGTEWERILRAEMRRRGLS